MEKDYDILLSMVDLDAVQERMIECEDEESLNDEFDDADEDIFGVSGDDGDGEGETVAEGEVDE